MLKIIKKYFTDYIRFNKNLVNDLNIAHKEIYWRIHNLGQIELEYIIFKWYNNN